MSLATAHMMLGQYEEAEIPARAAFESMFAAGGEGLAPYALMLQQIYVALGRDADARAVMTLADAGEADYSSR